MELVDRTITEPKFLPGEPVQHAVVLHSQEPFLLSKASYFQLRQADPVLTALGGSLVVFGVGQALDVLLHYLRPSEGKQVSLDLVGVTAGGMITAIGLGLILWGMAYSRPRKEVMKEIESHFENNPAKPRVEISSRR